MATIQSLVEHKTLVIEESDFAATGDKVYVDGHFYSDKPPVPALIGALIYTPLYALGLRLHPGYGAAYYVITLLSVSVAWLFGTLALFSSLRYTGISVNDRMMIALALGVGSLFLTWATTFNNHEIAGGCISLGFMFALRARFEGGIRNVILAGLFLSTAAAADIPTGIFFLSFLIYVAAFPQMRRHVVFFLVPVALTGGITAIVDFAIHGSVMPVQIYPQYFLYSGSPWLGTSELSGMKLNAPGFICNYAIGTLLGPAGFLLYNPFVVFGIFGSISILKKRSRFAPEALCMVSASLILCAYYWATSTNYGGRSYSIRWFVPLLPMVLYFLFPYFQQITPGRRRAYWGLLTVSTVIALVGALNPWSALASSNVPFVDNIREFFVHLPPGFRM